MPPGLGGRQGSGKGNDTSPPEKAPQFRRHRAERNNRPKRGSFSENPPPKRLLLPPDDSLRMVEEVSTLPDYASFSSG